jgi:hypothetical protein
MPKNQKTKKQKKKKPKSKRNLKSLLVANKSEIITA